MKDNNNASAATAALLQGLRQHTEGLLYQSETDAPFEVVYYPGTSINTLAAPQLATWAGLQPEANVETVALSSFLRNITAAPPGAEAVETQTALHFQGLETFLEQHLQQVKVYKVGRRKITAFILGTTSTGAIAGLKTTLVET